MKLLQLTLKQWILLFLTILALIPVVLALISSVTQPQIQANLQLYQTNLILQAAEFPAENSNLEAAQKALLGNNPYATAELQYQEARQLAHKNIDLFRENRPKKLVLSPKKKVVKEEVNNSIYEAKNFVKDLDLKLGLIKVAQGKTNEALQIWQNLLDNSSKKPLVTKPRIIKNATLLKGLWSDPPNVTSETEARIKDKFQGWFRYRSLKRLYEIENRQEDLAILIKQQTEVAYQALVKLILIVAIPLLWGLLGVSILIFLLAQFFLKRQQSLLILDKELAWQTPWDLEIILQVLIVGFFLVGQFLLPILFSVTWGVLSINPTEFSLRYKAIYVLISYVALTVSALFVLYVSLKPFFPLPKDWFQFKWLSNWILWGLGGYFVALPIVIVISIINQQIWQGQGGSNPLLMLALESQDKVALALFFITASIAAPVFEEIIFRGFLLPSLTRYMSVWGAIIVSAFIFALAHLSLSEVLPLATLGIILGFVYTRSRNLLSSILLHSLWNSGTLISLFILGSNIE